MEWEQHHRNRKIAEAAATTTTPTLTPALALTLTLARPLQMSVRLLRARGSSSSCAHAAPSTISTANQARFTEAPGAAQGWSAARSMRKLSLYLIVATRSLAPGHVYFDAIPSIALLSKLFRFS